MTRYDVPSPWCTCRHPAVVGVIIILPVVVHLLREKVRGKVLVVVGPRSVRRGRRGLWVYGCMGVRVGILWVIPKQVGSIERLVGSATGVGGIAVRMRGARVSVQVAVLVLMVMGVSVGVAVGAVGGRGSRGRHHAQRTMEA